MNSVKPVFKFQPPVDKTTFAQSTCLLTISVGQEVHEGDKFAATLDLVNASFKGCVMVVDDSLQRHSMALDKPQNADFFYDLSIKAGDAWLERNEKHYRQLKNLTQIVRWDRWLKHDQYLQQQAAIKSLMSADADYRASFETTISEFLRRYTPRLLEQADFDEPRARALCMDYLVEECTALCLWSELGCRFEVYPGRRNGSMHATHQRLVVPQQGDILHPIAIKFKNRKQLKPQRFEHSPKIELTPQPIEA